MICFSPRTIQGKTTGNLRVPCGICGGCRANKAEEWAIRITWELPQHGLSSFVTLTMSDENYPADESVSKRTLQLFLKRLRKLLKNRKIKYFACGEYGETKGRAHYHACLLGVSPIEKKTIEKAWGLGGVDVKVLNKSRARYTAGYLLKEVAPNINVQGRTKPFALMSKGMGASVLQNENTVRRIVKGEGLTHNGKMIPIPRYLKKLADPLNEGGRLNAHNANVDALLNHIQRGKTLPDQTNISNEKVARTKIGDAMRSMREARKQAEENLKAKNHYRTHPNEPV